MEINKSQIKKIGKQIRKDLIEGKNLNENDLASLQEYRISHLESLQKVFNSLTYISRHHYKGSLSVYRLKRIDTIIRKIERYPNMSLATMQDIAGCRAIVGSEHQIKKIVSDFEKLSEFEIIKRDDYISNPRETGYSSYHLIIKPINNDRVIEVQIRTRANHHWATLVEITDLLYDTKLKEGQIHPELFLFHNLLSIHVDKLTLDQKLSIINIENNLSVVTKLINIFNKNYFIAIERWTAAISNDKAQYLIMQIDHNLSPSFEFFENFEIAENEYFKNFALNEPNMVLIHVNNVDFENIGIAYSNYILTSHPSIKFYLEILQKTILELFKKGNINRGKKLFDYYDNLIVEIFSSFEDEILSIKRKKIDEEVYYFQKVKNHLKYNEILDEWVNNFNLRFNALQKEHTTFLTNYNKLKNKKNKSDLPKIYKPDTIMKRIINLIIGE